MALQRSAGNQAVSRLLQKGPARRNLRQAAGSSIGEKLPDSVAAKFSSSFGRDLGHVSVHHDSAASRAVSETGGNAFAWGNRIFFREGAYQPQQESGHQLLAHELAHVVQQTGPGAKSEGRGAPDSETAACRAAESHREDAETLPAGPATPVHVAADNGIVYEDPEKQASGVSTENELLDTIVDTEAEANRQREAEGATTFETGKLDTKALYLRDEAAKVVAKNAAPNAKNKPQMPVSSPDLRDASKEEIAAHQRDLLRLDLTVKNPKDRDVIARDIDNTAAMSDYANKTYSIVIGGHGVFGLREHQAVALVRSMMSDLESDTQLLQTQVGQAHELRENTSSWVTGPIHFWGGSWDEIEAADFQKTNQLRYRARVALESGKIDDAIDLLRDSYYEYRSVNDRFSDYQEGIQRGGQRMIKLLSTAERAGRGALMIANPIAGAAYSFGQESLQQEEMVRRGLQDHIDWSGNLKNAAWGAVVGKFTGGVSKFVGGATQSFGPLASGTLSFGSGIGTSSLLTWTNPVDAFTDPATLISMVVAGGYRAPGAVEPGAIPNEPTIPNAPSNVAEPPVAATSEPPAPVTAEPPNPIASDPARPAPAPQPNVSEPGPPASTAAAPVDQALAQTPAPQPNVSEPAPPATTAAAPVGQAPAPVTPDQSVAQPPEPQATEALQSALATTDPSTQVSTIEESSLTPDPNPQFEVSGSGHTQWNPALNIDEPQAVGEENITQAESMRRAMDLSSRQFLDALTNQGTKGNKVEIPSSARSAPDLSPTSVADNPAALLTRPRLGGILEWDQLSADVLSRKAASLVGKTAKQVKNILNHALRDEIKSPTTPYGQAISDALSNMLGVPAQALFGKAKLRVINKPSGRFQ